MANGFLDGLAGEARAQGAPALAVHWGAWSAIGMVAENRAVRAAMERSGYGLVRPAAGLAALTRVIALCDCSTSHLPGAQVGDQGEVLG